VTVMKTPQEPVGRSAPPELEELQRRCARWERLYQVGNVIHSTLDSQEALRLIVNEAVRLMSAASGSVVLLNPHTNLLEIHASCGLEGRAAELKLRLGQGLTGWVARTGRAARVDDVTKDLRYFEIRPDTRSELAVPLEVNGEIRGVLNVDSDRIADRMKHCWSNWPPRPPKSFTIPGSTSSCV